MLTEMGLLVAGGTPKPLSKVLIAQLFRVIFLTRKLTKYWFSVSWRSTTDGLRA